MDSEQRESGIFENAPIALLTLDRNGVICRANKVAREAFGGTDLQGIAMSTLIAGQDRSGFQRAVYRSLTHKSREAFEARIVNSSHPPTIFHFKTGPNDQPTVTGDVVLVAGNEAFDRYTGPSNVKSIIDCSPDAMIIFAYSGAIVDINKQAERLFGADLAALKGLHITELLGKRFRRRYGPSALEKIRRKTSNDRIASRKMRLQRAGNEEFCAVTKISAISTSAGELFIASLRDISQERAAMKAAMKARSAALRASRTKSQFLANMSHELRTPITAIMGFAELLSDEINGQSAQKFLGSIRKNSDHLRQVINDILDISSIESGKLKISRKSGNVREIIVEAFETMRVHASDKGLDYRFFIDETVPERAMIDAMRVKQVLLNLIGNAIKFTDTGYVHVDARAQKVGKRSYHLDIAIADSGCGIAEDQTKNLFTLFYQADAGTNRRYGGTGLGLAVSKNLAALMDGDVRLLRTKRGEGSEFVFAINISETGASSASKRRITSANRSASKAPLANLKVLVVEDGEDIQLLLKSFLRKAGAVVDQAINGLEGYQKALHGDYDAVLMDIQMPIVDGLEATEMLRRQNYGKPIIAVSANAFPRDVGLSIDAGCNDHISKPIQYDTLIAKLKHWTESGAPL